ncbi:MAG: STAS domain-containing protein [Candidatus Marinamargulisbacteria bacterium]
MIDLAINVTENKNWQVITLKGELDDYQSTKLTKTFNKLIDESQSVKIILNLDEVSFVDSVGLGTIAIAGKKLLEKTGHLHIVCSQQKIAKMVNMSGIISATKQTIQIFETIDAAVL